MNLRVLGISVLKKHPLFISVTVYSFQEYRKQLSRIGGELEVKDANDHDAGETDAAQDKAGPAVNVFHQEITETVGSCR